MEENKKLDDFIKSSMKEIDLEKPSIDFTDTVLSKIGIEAEKNTVLDNKPVFSKRIWFVIITLFVAIVGYVILGDSNMESAWLSASQLNKLAAFNLSAQLPKLPFSNTLFYGVLISTLFIWIQVFLLKNRFERQVS